MQLPKDESTDDRLTPVSTNNLPCVIEEDDDNDDESSLEQLRDIGERAAAEDAATENVDPDTIMPDERSADPMTPPMTPKELESEVEELEQEEKVAQDVQEIDEDEAEEQQELSELEKMAERNWWQKAVDVVAHPITWVAAVGLAFAVATAYSKLHSGVAGDAMWG